MFLFTLWIKNSAPCYLDKTINKTEFLLEMNESMYQRPAANPDSDSWWSSSAQTFFICDAAALSWKCYLYYPERSWNQQLSAALTRTDDVRTSARWAKTWSREPQTTGQAAVGEHAFSPGYQGNAQVNHRLTPDEKHHFLPHLSESSGETDNK